MKKAIAIGLILLTTACSQTSKKDSGYSGHGADSLSAKEIEKFAPKPLSDEQMRRIQSMLDIRQPTLGVLSSDAKNLYINWSVTGTSQIWKVPGAMQFPIQMTGGEDAARLQTITPDGKFLVISRDQKGDEYPGLYLQSTNGGELIEVYKKNKVQVFPEFVTKDSKFLYFRANDRNPKSYAIYKYNLTSRQIDLVFEGPEGYWSIDDNTNDGTLLLSNWKSNTASEYFLYNESDKKLIPLFGQNELNEFRAEFGQSKNEIIVLTNKFGEFRRLYVFKNSDFKPISPNWRYDVSNFYVDKARTKIIYETNNKGYTNIGAFALVGFSAITVPEFKDKSVLHVNFGSTTRDGRYSTLGMVRYNEPRSAYVYDWHTKQLKQWVIPSKPEISTSNFVVPQLEYYTARDGTKIPMFVKRPKECEIKTCPVVVDFHGGPEAQATPWFSPTDQLFLENGFILVEPNVRGSDGYGKTWLHSDNGPKRLEVITDIADAGIFIKKNWAKNGVTPKVAIMGGSYGGYSTYVGMTLFSDTYDAGVAVVGMSSLISFLQNTAPYRRALRVSEYGDPEKDKEALIKLSPIYHLDKIRSPLMIIHGATDPRVPAGEALQIYKVMEKKNLAGELILFADEGHGISKRKNQAVYYGHIIEFLKKHIKN